MGKNDIDFASMPQIALRVITGPAAFFRDMPKTGGFSDPLLFMVIMGGVSGIVQAVVTILGLKAGFSVGMAVLSIILLPVLFGIFGFIGAAILFFIWKFMGSQESYETSYRCLAYLCALFPITTLLGIIPYVGSLVAIILIVYFYVVMSVETHKVASQRAWLVFGTLGLIVLLLNMSAGLTQLRIDREKARYEQQLEETTREMQRTAEETRKELEELKKKMEKKD